MKKLKKIGQSKLKFVLIGLFAVVGTILVFKAHAAGSATLTLSPSSGSHDINTTFTVVVYENSGAEQVNSVQSDLSYDASKLQFVSIDTSSSAFGIAAAASGGGGSVTIQRGTLSPLSGNQIVGSVTFKALVGSGTAAINFANSSLIYRQSDTAEIWNHNPAGGVYNLTTPASTPPPSTPPPSTGGSSGSGSTSSSGSTSTSKTSGSSGSTSSGPAPSSPSSQEQASDPSKPVAVDTTADASNDGFLVAIKVVDADGKPIEGATVTINGQTAKTDSTGVAGFTKMPAGKHTVTVSSAKGQVKSDVTVNGNASPTAAQVFNVKVKKQPNLFFIFSLTTCVVAVAALAFWLMRSGTGKTVLAKVGVGSDAPKSPSAIQPPAEVIKPGSSSDVGDVIKPSDGVGADGKEGAKKP